MASGGAYDVFVSYARSDEAGAVELNGWLCARGLSTFFDRSALRAGLRWIPALEDAIGRSKAIAILVGSHGIGNTQQYERELALVRKSGDKKFPVIPVLMPGCESPPAGFLQLLTWIDLSKGPSAPHCAATRSPPPTSGRPFVLTAALSHSGRRTPRSFAAAMTRSASSPRVCKTIASSLSSAHRAAANRRSSSQGWFPHFGNRAARRCGMW
jgi:hypothetical protein